MDEECGTHERNENRTQNFGGIPEGKRPLGEVGLEGMFT
jgi:hypothetical protein